MATATIAIEYEVDGEGCKDPELELLELVSGNGSAIIHDDYHILIHSMEIIKGGSND